MTPPDVRQITAPETHDLRRLVLRNGAVDAMVVWDGDDEPETEHLGVFADGRIVAISTWLVRPDPIAPGRSALQLRGMAADPTQMGMGLGRALLRAGLQRARHSGRDRVWANARLTALGFYESEGWEVSGPVFDTPMTGLPHRHAHRDLD